MIDFVEADGLARMLMFLPAHVVGCVVILGAHSGFGGMALVIVLCHMKP